MTNEEYWEGDCVLVKAYREADKIKEERLNQRLWLQGMYFYEALCDVSPLMQAFAKKGTKAIPYSSEPYAVTAEQVKRKKEKEEKLKYEKIKAKMAKWAEKTNAVMAERGEQDG